MSKIRLIYDNYASWEKDYIKILFNKIDYDIMYLEKEQIKIKLYDEDKIINNNILVFSSNHYGFIEILNIVLRIKPLIIVHLSDEFGNKPEYTHLAAYTKLFLHQHHFHHYPYNNYNNIIQIPLGYMTGMFDNKNPLNFQIKPLLKRKYKWSFIGNMKRDRTELICKFSQNFKDGFFGNKLNPQEMFNIYNDTIFVPNGRGNVRIDCFRIYEAILSGSIPVIVCDENEFKDTFFYNNDIPQFILEKNWEDAIHKCKYLLDNIEELKNIQKNNYEWLEKKIKLIQETIHSTLN
uniref:Exostosin GT47 domain-containing protein n=1 Tax=viral metagenome TaxID=1070528 RepID=A0A6C0IKQ2_9ZZZZ